MLNARRPVPGAKLHEGMVPIFPGALIQAQSRQQTGHTHPQRSLVICYLISIRTFFAATSHSTGDKKLKFCFVRSYEFSELSC